MLSRNTILTLCPLILMSITPSTCNLSKKDSYSLEMPSENWLSYGGDYRSWRHSKLEQINKYNIGNLGLIWRYPIKDAELIPTTPLIKDGIMYFAERDVAYAVDIFSKKQIWQSSLQYLAFGKSRGVAISEDRLYFITSDCMLVAVDLINGETLWEKTYADQDKGYYCTVAPLVVKDKVIVGVSSGHGTIRGFVAAMSFNGDELWRFWTVPDNNDPEIATWGGGGFKIGGAATWVTGSYDPELNLLYWPTGNPWPYFTPEERPGDNLYSDCMLALNPDSGNLAWYFQFTPGDGHDWDATESPVLAEINWQGVERKILAQANRNGFFYVLDRVTGEFLFANPFVEKLNWASGLTKEGRPIVVPGKEATREDPSQALCPYIPGATNWMPPAFNPRTGLLYVVTIERCRHDTAKYFLKAINIQNGLIKWKYEMESFSKDMTAGVLSTAGDLVFFGDDNKNLICLNANSGNKLWSYNLGLKIFAPPVTFLVKGKQHISIFADSDLFTFGLL